jgi:hypothetical protein
MVLTPYVNSYSSILSVMQSMRPERVQHGSKQASHISLTITVLLTAIQLASECPLFCISHNATPSKTVS